MRCYCWVLGMLLVVAPLSAAEPAKPIEVRAVDRAGFDKAIADQKGKIVVVDFWAEYCAPCKEAFPHLLELQEKYGKDGVVVIAVNIDDPKDKDVQKRAMDFLKEKNAGAITNLGVAATDPDWPEKLKVKEIPRTQVYSREGKMEKAFTGIRDEEVEKLLMRLLKAKKK